MNRFGRVGVVGAGLMGGGIAQVAATAGYSVTVRDVDDGILERAREGIARSLGKFVEKGKLPADAAEGARERLAFTTDLAALGGCDLVIEAVTEDLGLKNRVFAGLHAACPPETVFASNTSSLPIAAMAAPSGRADRFVGLHFFSPVPLMPLVEVVRALATSDDTFARAMAFARSLGKEAIAAKDTPGFIVNRLLVPYLMDAVRALERGVASTRDIDLGMKLGCGHPMGPLTLADMIGLDTVLRVGDIMFDEFREPHYAPPPLLRRMVTMGYLGRKSGRGFYDYSGEEPVVVEL
jgi:3-hydroxybutyryl-CoA dehydrogenase